MHQEVPRQETHTVFELRQYSLVRSRIDDLVALFDEVLVEAQEESGMRIVGQFPDLDRPDHFVWVRSFRDVSARSGALSGCYGGPVWSAHRDAANSAMIDSSNARLLEPVFDRGVVSSRRPVIGSEVRAYETVTCTTLPFDRAVNDAHVTWFGEALLSNLVASGNSPVGLFRRLYADNGLPALPVSDVHCIIWLCGFADASSMLAAHELLATAAVLDELIFDETPVRVETLRLRPTTRSLSLIGDAPCG